jgi:hypothetical protein
MSSAGDKDRPDQTLADYVGIALGPALVMTLVGSLVFFLLEICYAGAYVERMRWILSWFVFGIVLVCRIAMLPHISDRSWLYGIFIAGGTWLGLQGFVEYPDGSLIRELSPVINIGLIVIVWWSAGKLVRDCTNVDEDTDMSGEGLLQAAGMDATGQDRAAGKGNLEDEKTSTTGGISWWERYQRYRAKKEKKRTLGVWVIYFSFAALPLFGLGQSLIPPSDEHRRARSFWLLGIYVASGLGLLMTTCFLGLRRYLRQRRLKMPAAMTGVWLTCGVVLIVALLGAAAIVPRPQAEYPLFDLQSLTGKERSASNSAIKGDSAAKGEGRSGESSDKSDANQKSGQGKGEKGKEQGKDSSNSSGDQKGQSDSGGSKGDGKKGSGQDQSKGGDGQKDGKGGQAKKGSPQDGEKQKDSSNSKSEQSSSPSSAAERVASFLKWIVFAIVGLVTLGVVFFAVLRFLANFTGWAARFLDAWSKFWSGLFARRERKVVDDAPGSGRPKAPPPRPFSSFHNPFLLGQHWTPLEFCCYTFAAFEAWARERGVARLPGETPLEHAERVGDEIPDLEDDARRLALIFARGVYGPGELPSAVNDVLREVWEHMEAGSRHPLAV